MSGHVNDERIDFVRTLHATDPGAPTLCGDWNTAQLVAHLVLRERSVTELGGRLPVAALQRHAQHAIDEYVARFPYVQLVSRFESGPPIYSPWAIPALREAVNLLEYAVHHEDVRRAVPGAAPRILPVARQQAAWSRLRVAAKLTLRQVPQSVTLVWPSHGEIVSRKGGARAITVTGDPIELALVTMGRQRVAQVTYDGPPDEVASFAGARIAL
ncbi:TIGR03085 family metal-binding protein [Jatrophihabitans sp.]|uniref:TIGR03085 family metal-binding protein n=1 Tax=Jatrophihabitans sp. TaxID=1932789 RepID=UPI0030C6AEC5|nr:hypothetical protein [Jatrophihabitans sp.]